MTDLRVDLGNLQLHENPTEFDDKCGVKCTKKQKRRKFVEYIGPLKIVLLDIPPKIYRERLWGNAFIKFSYFAMGAAVSYVAYYSVSCKMEKPASSHVLFCTFGYQLCLPVAFFLTNPIDPTAVWMTSKHRIVDSLILRLFGVGQIVSSIIYYMNVGLEKKFEAKGEQNDNKLIKLFAMKPWHSYFGVIAVIASAFDLLFICCAFHKITLKFWKLFSIPALIFGSLAFCSGLLQTTIQDWFAVPEISKILIFFCAFYTLTALFRPIMDCIFKWRAD